MGGDTPGIEWRLPVFRFAGKSADAPSVYIQAALHANELPGTALIHFLCGRLRQAEAEGAIAGDITIVPHANPIGAAQLHFGEMQGRFDLGSRSNFNRDFPLIPLGDREKLVENFDRFSAVDRLKRTLLHMALGADLVLDLHCDDESLQYAYIDGVFWPGASDLASALDMEAVFLSDGESSAFEEAVGYAFKNPGEQRESRLSSQLSVTVELRGTRDVDAATARKDADGLWRFLAARGIVNDPIVSLPAYEGPAVPLDNIEMVRAEEPGTVLLYKNVGERVEPGDLLATILTQPGLANGALEVRASRAGLIATRTSSRFARRGTKLMKIVCDERATADRKPGTLED